MHARKGVGRGRVSQILCSKLILVLIRGRETQRGQKKGKMGEEKKKEGKRRA